ncbi:MAG: glycoside hydrolase family protein, partial [Bacteroidales bacterium]|nr:glycoside hydrolase family protein [Bacteroidales bacterium]
MDRFLPMPNLGGMTSNTWGADNVIPRDINNGIEDPKWSYWGGNARLHDDGKYHLFVCRWSESAQKGHMAWFGSTVVHAISDNSFGPYQVVEEVDKGHNPEWYITNDNKYVISVIRKYYIANSINGPWERQKYDFDRRDRHIIDGLSNLTFAKRADGSFVMICRGGGVWISKDGLSTWNQISDATVYPPVDGRFEDPLIWKTNVQYHLIVNDWLGRIAWHLRSKDGINWKTEAGEAYLPGIAVHKDGTKEDWFKYERIKVVQDTYGRAFQANFAVIDTLKHFDKKNDNHSSKNISIPLTVGKLMSVLNTKKITAVTKEIIVKIKAEEGFNPNTDIDYNSLRFGASEAVNFGGGSKVKSVKQEGDDVIITFHSEGNSITDDNFAAKLLGKTTQGKLLFAYSQLPGVTYIQAALSARKPKFNNKGTALDIVIENFGQIPSQESTIHIYKIADGEQKIIAKASIPTLKPYKSKTINIHTISPQHNTNKQAYLVLINEGKPDMVSFKTN